MPHNHWSRPSSPFKSSPGGGQSIAAAISSSPQSGSAYVFPAPIVKTSNLHHHQSNHNHNRNHNQNHNHNRNRNRNHNHNHTHDNGDAGAISVDATVGIHGNNSKIKRAEMASQKISSTSWTSSHPSNHQSSSQGMAQPAALQRNQSVSAQNGYPNPNVKNATGMLRRSRSFSEDHSNNISAMDSHDLNESEGNDFRVSRTVTAPPAHLRFHVDDAIHELLSSRHSQRGSKSRGFTLISSLFSCLMNPASGRNGSQAVAGTKTQYCGIDPNHITARPSLSERVAELLEISKKQQSELADKQDTIDMLEWQLEQMQAMAFKAGPKKGGNAAADLNINPSRVSLSGRATTKSEEEIDGDAVNTVDSCHGSAGKAAIAEGDHHCYVKECISNKPDAADVNLNENKSKPKIENKSKPAEEDEDRSCAVHEEDHSWIKGMDEDDEEEIENEHDDKENKGMLPSSGGEAEEAIIGLLLHTQEVRRIDMDNVGARGADIIGLIETATMRARLSIRTFSKAMIKQMEASGCCPVLRTLAGLEPGAVLARKEHAAYALESRINRAFFHCFENDSFDESGVTQILDPAARCSARLSEFRRMKLSEPGHAVDADHPSFDAAFRRFCHRKTKQLWSQFSWKILFHSPDEKEAFTSSFLEASKCVWLLHRLAFSIHPNLTILRVPKGLDIDPLYVDAVPDLKKTTKKKMPPGPGPRPSRHCPDNNEMSASLCPTCSRSKVEFLIMPGFQALDKLLVKCQVYQHIRCNLD